MQSGCGRQAGAQTHKHCHAHASTNSEPHNTSVAVCDRKAGKKPNTLFKPKLPVLKMMLFERNDDMGLYE